MTAFYRDNKGLESVSGDYLICTVPLEVMHRIEFAPGLSAGKLRTARQVTYDSSTKVLARTSRRFWESDEGIYGGGTYTDLPTGITYYPADNAIHRDPRVSTNPPSCSRSSLLNQRRSSVLPTLSSPSHRAESDSFRVNRHEKIPVFVH